MDPPRVNPSDWASRRQQAMSRAKELRSKLKERERESNQTPCDEPMTSRSRSDLQRQRRSRQLEETQRLLDGYDLNFDQATIVKSDAEAVSRRRSKQERVSSNDTRSSRQRDEVDTHSVISQEQLGRIHSKYKNGEGKHRDEKAERKSKANYNAAENNVARNSSMTEASESLNVLLDNGPNSTLRDRPIEGRGRGRGRGRSVTAGSHSSSVGSQSSSRSISHSGKQHGDRNSMIDGSRGSSSKEAFRSYLRERQVPGYKEGECEKLAILRQKLVARRKKRRNVASSSSSFDENKENDTNEMPKNNGLMSTGTKDSQTRRHVKERSERPLQTQDDERSSRYPDAQNLSLGDERSMHSPVSMDQSRISHSSAIKRNDSNIFDDLDGDEVVNIQLIECDFCKRSFAPKVYEKHFADGQPKCQSQMAKKRAVFNSAKARIANNDNLNRDEQMQVLQTQKKVAKELKKKQKSGGGSKKSKKNSKWQQESNALREAMKANRAIKRAELEGKPAHYYL